MDNTYWLVSATNASLTPGPSTGYRVNAASNTLSKSEVQATV